MISPGGLIFFGFLFSFLRLISSLQAGVGVEGVSPASAHLRYLLYFEHSKESTCGNCVFS